MHIQSEAFASSTIPDRFGGRGGEFHGPMSGHSFPLEIIGAPEGTVSYALVFDDPEAVGPPGFVFVHWLVSGFKTPVLEEGASRLRKDLVQGVTSFFPKRIEDRADACFYGGPNPPDRPHNYVLRVFALDFEPDLKTGFSREELLDIIKGHVLEECRLSALYSPQGYSLISCCSSYPHENRSNLR